MSTKGLINISLIVAALVVLGGIGPATQSASAVTVDFSIDEGPVTYRASGSFWVGLVPLDLVHPLKTKLMTWITQLRRVATVETDAKGNKIVSDEYNISKKLGAAFQWKLGCRGLNARDGSWFLNRDALWPGDNGDWTAWLAFVQARVEEAKEKGATPEFDICNEPDAEWKPTQPWNVGTQRSYTQYLETWRQSVLLIRKLNPAAVITGPSAAFFPFVRDTFLPYAVHNTVVPDVLSWHGYQPDNGGGIAAEVAEAKKYFTDRNLPVPKISINEYQGRLDTYNGAISVKYFYELERAKVDSAAKGCWNELGEAATGGWACNFNNTLTSPSSEGANDRKPRSNWWAFKGYADITGRLVRFVPHHHVYGVAGYDQSKNEARAVLGKIGGEKQETTIEFKYLSRTSLAKSKAIWVEAYYVPASGLEQATPVKVIAKAYPLTNDHLTVTLPPDFGPGDVYTVILRPSASSNR